LDGSHHLGGEPVFMYSIKF